MAKIFFSYFIKNKYIGFYISENNFYLHIPVFIKPLKPYG